MQVARDTRRGLLIAALAAYLVIAGCIAFWPTPVDQAAGPWLAWFFDRAHAHGIPVWINYDLLEFLANVVFFIPLTFMLTILLGRRRWWFALLIGVAVSVSIEMFQLEFIEGRFASSADVIANTLGAVVGLFAGRCCSCRLRSSKGAH